MDSEAIARIAVLTESIIRDIRRHNDSRFEQRVNSELLTIDLRVDKEAEVKASKLLAEKIERSDELRQVQAERAKIKQEVIDKFKKFLFSIGVNLSKTIPALAIMLLCVAAGLPLGLNILPSAVTCKSVDSLCYHLRLNKKTTIAPDKSVVKDKRGMPLKQKTKNGSRKKH